MTFLRSISLALLALAAIVSPRYLRATEEELLAVDQAFIVSATALDHGTIQLQWKIAPNYYLYRERIKVTTPDAGMTLAAHELPVGEKKHDEYLGDVEVYHHDFTSKQKLGAAAGATLVNLAVRFQGCHEVDPKICFPPHVTKLSVALPGDAQQPAGGALAIPGSSSGLIALGGEPLPVDKAFVFETIPNSPNELLARFTMAKGYYLYRDKTTFDSPDAKLAAPGWPPGKTHEDANFGTTTVYFDQVDVPIAFDGLRTGAKSLHIDAHFQGCLDGGVCYPLTTRGVDVNLPNASADAVGSAEAQAQQQPRPQTPAAPATFGTLLAALLGALLGGLVLNLMPCVLPVLSLKALAILEGGESPQKARRHVLFYTAGVLISFAVVGLAVITLRKAGLIYGWGFQLQQPLFVAILVYVITAVGLSLSGIVQFGAGLAGAGQGLTARAGPAGDFFTGVLAVVVASPCTAPFMGSALAFAFASSAWIAFLVFIALGLGLALPFLAIGFVPALGRFLPRPGAWMETLKQVLAFPMYLTAVWLVWVLGGQRGVDAIGLVLAGTVVLALGLWWFERSRNDGAGWRALALAALLLSVLPLYTLTHLQAPSKAGAQTQGQIAFNPAKLDELRHAGKSVFIDIGADWCTTCKVNEHAVLATDAFRDLLKRTDTTFMVGDWTNPDPDIEAFLARFHAVGVPLYVVFRNGDEGRALPTVLTESIVQNALEGATEPSRTAAR